MKRYGAAAYEEAMPIMLDLWDEYIRLAPYGSFHESSGIPIGDEEEMLRFICEILANFHPALSDFNRNSSTSKGRTIHQRELDVCEVLLRSKICSISEGAAAALVYGRFSKATANSIRRKYQRDKASIENIDALAEWADQAKRIQGNRELDDDMVSAWLADAESLLGVGRESAYILDVLQESIIDRGDENKYEWVMLNLGIRP